MSLVSLDNLVLYTGIIILINLVLFSYILKLEREKCKCSDNWMRDYIKYYTSILVILSLITLMVPVFLGEKTPKIMKPLTLVIRIVVLLATLVQVYVVFAYSQALNCKKKSCKCSKDWRGSFMYWLGIFGFVIYVLMLLVFITCAFVRSPLECFA
jgi:hypothetical protein